MNSPGCFCQLLRGMLEIEHLSTGMLLQPRQVICGTVTDPDVTNAAVFLLDPLILLVHSLEKGCRAHARPRYSWYVGVHHLRHRMRSCLPWPAGNLYHRTTCRCRPSQWSQRKPLVLSARNASRTGDGFSPQLVPPPLLRGLGSDSERSFSQLFAQGWTVLLRNYCLNKDR